MADQPPQTAPRSPQVVRAVTAVTIGGSLLVLSGLTLTVTVIGLTVATPLLVIFSPVLVPAVITAFFILAGFLSSGGLGVAALSVLSWIYKYLTGKHPVGAEKLDEVQRRVGSKTRDVKEHLGQQLQQQTQQSGQAS